jgi:hypothetical protein
MAKSKATSNSGALAREPAAPASAKALVDSMLSSESLPALVEQMAPAALARLVDDLGIEDSGALVVHATETQLVHLLDATIWSGAQPGAPETLSVENLLRWLAVWEDNGITSDKLYELGEDFCALAFSRLVIVADSDLSERVDDEFTRSIGTYILRSRVDDEWDVVQASLSSLWDDFPDYAEAVFGRLAFRHSILSISGENDVAAVLDADASYDRDRKREAQGYVTSLMAGTFLRSTAATELDLLAAEEQYDLSTSEYFRRHQAEAQAVERAEAEKRAASSDDVDLDDELELDELEAELEAYELAAAEPPKLLAAPAEVQARQPIRDALRELQGSEERFEQYGEELAYLANLVMAGTSRDGEYLSEAQAAEIVMASCNLGGSYLLWIEFGDDEDITGYMDLLAAESGLIRLFRVGWHLLARVPLQTVTRLGRLIDDSATREALAQRPMVLGEVEALLSDNQLLEQVRGEQFADARETVGLLTILLEPGTVHALCELVDATPRLSSEIERPSPGAEFDVSTAKARNIDSMADLMSIDGFLKSLAERIRGGG